MAIIVPNAASYYGAAACVPNSENKWVWLGITTPISSSGCVTWSMGPSTTSACNRIVAIAACAADTKIYGPFNSACGVSAASFGGTGACAVVWMKR
jgi:hypothetical protein